MPARVTLLALLAACHAPAPGGTVETLAALASIESAGSASFAQSPTGWSAPGSALRVTDEGLGTEQVTLRTRGLAGALQPAGRFLLREGDGLTEWYTPVPEGIEHGWVVHEPAAHVTIDVEVEGARAWPALEGVLLTTADSELAYRHIRAWDADGAPLQAHLGVHGAALRVDVVTDRAVFPVTIDPVLTDPSRLVTSSAARSWLGYDVANAGDLDGDGDEELLSSAPRYDNYTGEVYLSEGTSTGYTGDHDLTFTTSELETAFGFAVAGIGDVNGDGYDDMAIGAPWYEERTGQMFVYYGSASGPSTTANLTLTGEDEEQYYGASLAPLGDLDSDGYDDFAVGAYGYGDYAGRVYVYFGSASGPDTASPNTYDGEDTYAYFGFSIAGGADGDNDGRDDALFGAYRYNANTGRVYLHRGRALGLSPTADVTLDGDASTSFGHSLSWIGDANGDGYADAIVGAYQTADYTGEMYVFDGNAKGLATSPSQDFTSDEGDAHFGNAVIGLGDINADGYADAAASAYGYDEDRGIVHVYEGGTGGLFETAQITGENTGDYFGWSLAGPGDTNNDGYADLVVGAYSYGDIEGRVYVYTGYADNDRDGYAADEDCDDENAFAHPGGLEIPGDGVDGDCDGTEFCYTDADGDGWRAPGVGGVASADTDCDDPGEASLDDGYVDCDDTDPAVNPDAVDTPGDGVDGDCNLRESCYVDGDGDGYHSDSTVETVDLTCSAYAPPSTPGGDCNDLRPEVHPGATEIVGDALDFDCDGGELCWVDADDDGYRPDTTDTVASADVDCADAGEANDTRPTGDCDDTNARYHPGASEADCADTNDYNCDGVVKWGDADADGVGTCGDCDDNDSSRYPGAPESCNGVDDDCDGVTDENPEDGIPYFADADGDGYPDRNTRSNECDPPEGWLPEGDWDCDDTDPGRNPGTEDAPGNGIDENCDGVDATEKESGCGCASSPAQGVAGGLALLGALLLRRRDAARRPAR